MPAFQKAYLCALKAAGYPLVRGTAKVPEAKLAGFVAANPELNLDEAAIRLATRRVMPAAKMIRDKLMTAKDLQGGH